MPTLMRVDRYVTPSDPKDLSTSNSTLASTRRN
jgi:hypothetical protein